MGERRCRRVRVALRTVTHHALDRWAGDGGLGGRSRLRSGGGCAGDADAGVACVARVAVFLRLSPRPSPTVAAPSALDEHAHHGAALAVAELDAVKRARATASTPPPTSHVTRPEAIPREHPCGACPAPANAMQRRAPPGSGARQPLRAGQHARAVHTAWPLAGALGAPGG